MTNGDRIRNLSDEYLAKKCRVRTSNANIRTICIPVLTVATIG